MPLQVSLHEKLGNLSALLDKEQFAIVSANKGEITFVVYIYLAFHVMLLVLFQYKFIVGCCRNDLCLNQKT